MSCRRIPFALFYTLISVFDVSLFKFEMRVASSAYRSSFWNELRAADVGDILANLLADDGVLSCSTKEARFPADASMVRCDAELTVLRFLCAARRSLLDPKFV